MAGDYYKFLLNDFNCGIKVCLKQLCQKDKQELGKFLAQGQLAYQN
jgi:hypothetical protein